MWFIKSGDKEHGPFSSAQLKKFAEHRRITPNSQVRRGDAGKWVRASKVRGLLFPIAESLQQRAEDPNPEAQNASGISRFQGWFIVVFLGIIVLLAVGERFSKLTMWMPYQLPQTVIREIEQMGGSVKTEFSGPEWLGFGKVVDVDLTGTQVTNAGLEHLKGLTNLYSLSLSVYSTQVTDAGLKHLKGLTNLQTLSLSDTQVTDAGLEHLKGLTNLQYLWLYGTQVTDAGVAKLQNASGDHLEFVRFGEAF